MQRFRGRFAAALAHTRSWYKCCLATVTSRCIKAEGGTLTLQVALDGKQMSICFLFLLQKPLRWSKLLLKLSNINRAQPVPDCQLSASSRQSVSVVGVQQNKLAGSCAFIKEVAFYGEIKDKLALRAERMRQIETATHIWGRLTCSWTTVTFMTYTHQGHRSLFFKILTRSCSAELWRFITSTQAHKTMVLCCIMHYECILGIMMCRSL